MTKSTERNSAGYTDAEERAYQEGHVAGVRGDHPTAPYHGGPRYHAWQSGHRAGRALVPAFATNMRNERRGELP